MQTTCLSACPGANHDDDDDDDDGNGGDGGSKRDSDLSPRGSSGRAGVALVARRRKAPNEIRLSRSRLKI